jgi:hypothetical protein
MPTFIEERTSVLLSGHRLQLAHQKQLTQTARAIVNAVRSRWDIDPDLCKLGTQEDGTFFENKFRDADDQQRLEFDVRVLLDAYEPDPHWVFWLPVEVQRTQQGIFARVDGRESHLVVSPSGGAFNLDTVLHEFDTVLTEKTEDESSRFRLKP